MKTKEDFLLTYKIQEEDFKAADISWETLTKIHDDYKDKREKDYCDAGKRLSQNRAAGAANICMTGIPARLYSV